MHPKSKTTSNQVDNNMEEREDQEVGQGELYSPDHAVKIDPSKHPHQTTHSGRKRPHLGEQREFEGSSSSGANTMVGIGHVAMDVKTRMGQVKDKLLEKLTAAAVPSDALENAKHFLETVVRDVTAAAQGLTKEALQKIKSHLADILPSLSPSLTSKMVDDAEKEAGGGERSRDKVEEKSMKVGDEEQSKNKLFASPVSSLFSKATSKL